MSFLAPFFARYVSTGQKLLVAQRAVVFFSYPVSTEVPSDLVIHSS